MKTSLTCSACRRSKTLSKLLALACVVVAPAHAEDRTCARMKALTVAAVAGFPTLSGPVLEQGPAGTVVAPTQDLVPMVGECQLRRPAKADGPAAELSCSTPLKAKTSANVAKDAQILVNEFGKCLGMSAQKLQGTGSAEPAISHLHTWVFRGPAETPWLFKISILEPNSRAGSANDALSGRFVSSLSSR